MIYKLKSKLILKINGKNVIWFIKKLYNKKIDILGIEYKNKDEIYIKIYKKDYHKIEKIKSIYEINIQGYDGINKITKKIILYKYLFIFLIFGYILLILLTNTIFKVEVIHSNKEIRCLVINELDRYGIKKYKFKKSYNEIQKIKNKIKNNNKDKIDWIEIQEKGTTYEVRIEERKIKKEKNNNIYQNIVSKKNATIKTIIATDGEIIKNIDDYVQKGETVISGDIKLNDEIKAQKQAKGKIYGEVWYVVTVNYPFIYQEKKETNQFQKIYVINFLNKKIELTLHHFKYKNIKSKNIISHNLLPLKITQEYQYKQKKISEVLTFDQALIRAKEYATNKIKSKLNDKEYIIKSKYLKSSVKGSKIEVEIFFAVYEDITDYAEIR